MCEYLVSAPWFLGLVVVSGVIGAIGAFIFYLFIRYVTGAGNDEKIWSREFLYSGFATGIVERFFWLFVAFIRWTSELLSLAAGHWHRGTTVDPGC